jgi:hypothetical protein
VSKPNRDESNLRLPPFANPYYTIQDIAPILLRLAEDDIGESFEGKSYCLEGLLHLFIRRNWKQRMRILWPDITRIIYCTFEFREDWQFFTWKSRGGILREIQPTHTQNWEDLKTLAEEHEGECVPEIIKEFPILLMLFLIVFPHRLNAEVMRWLDTQIKLLP